jgi:tetratricopeptide (TPR) repeat protein
MWEVQEQLYQLLPEGDPRLFAMARLYMGSNRAAKAVAMLQQSLDQAATDEPGHLIRLLLIARFQLNQTDKIDDDFRKAFKKFPQHEPDLRYRWASSHLMREDRPTYIRLLIETHEKFPDHPPTNNDLGYLWIEQHEHLEQALQMVRKAVDAEPNNAAYLDSLGWAYYKLAQFDDAVVWLRKSEQQAQADRRQRTTINELATHAVVLDHLGDAIYRQGDPAAAQRLWQQAQKLLTNQADHDDDQLSQVQEQLARKIAAHKQQKPVPTSPVPDAQPSSQPPPQ